MVVLTTFIVKYGSRLFLRNLQSRCRAPAPNRKRSLRSKPSGRSSHGSMTDGTSMMRTRWCPPTRRTSTTSTSLGEWQKGRATVPGRARAPSRGSAPEQPEDVPGREDSFSQAGCRHRAGVVAQHQRRQHRHLRDGEAEGQLAHGQFYQRRAPRSTVEEVSAPSPPAWIRRFATNSDHRTGDCYVT
jgi:hypothetical protein